MSDEQIKSKQSLQDGAGEQQISVEKVSAQNPKGQNHPNQDVEPDVKPDKVKKSSAKQAKASANVVLAHEKPLPVLLLDDALGFTYVQREILALAHHLRNVGFEVVFVCPKQSQLLQKAQEGGFLSHHLNYDGKKVSIGLRIFLKLFWIYKKASPLCVHAFSVNCLTLLRRLVVRRLQGATLTFYTAFDKAPNALIATTTKPQSTPKIKHEGIPAPPTPPAPINAKSKEVPTKNLLPSLAKNLAHVDKVFVSSSYVRGTWADFGFDVARLKVIRAAQPFEHFPIIAKDEHRFIFIVVEDFTENGNIDVIFQTMAELEKNQLRCPFEVRIVGEGAEYEKYLRRAQMLGIDKNLAMFSNFNVDFPLEDVLRHGHALILPQGGPQGNMAACMAAWSLSLPIVASNIPEYQELVEVAARVGRGFKGGIHIVSVQDAIALANYMQELINNEEKYSELVKASECMQNYASMSRLQEKYLEAYQSSIASLGWVLPQKKK